MLAISARRAARLGNRMVRADPAVTAMCRRCMASGRGHYIRGASNKQDISEETRELLKQVRNPEEPKWKLGHGIQEPIVMDLSSEERKRATQYIQPYYGRARTTELGSDDTVQYYPNQEDTSTQPPPSPVLMVKRIKTLVGEPWYYCHYLEQIGLGKRQHISKLSFLPNLPSVGLLLFKIKHLVQITPLTFPNGIPEDFDPEMDGSFLKSNGEFLIHPSLKVNPEEVADRADWMKLELHHIHREARRHWMKPFNTVLGNSNYYRDSRWIDNDAADTEARKNAKKKY